MAFRTTYVALLLSTLVVTGCGTVKNLAAQKPGQDGVSPFGGVKHDLRCIRQEENGEFGCKRHPRSDSEQSLQWAATLFCVVDLPFSLIGDIVTCPYTATYSYINQPISVPPVVQVEATGQGLAPAPVALQGTSRPAKAEENQKGGETVGRK